MSQYEISPQGLQYIISKCVYTLFKFSLLSVGKLKNMHTREYLQRKISACSNIKHSDTFIFTACRNHVPEIK